MCRRGPRGLGPRGGLQARLGQTLRLGGARKRPMFHVLFYMRTNELHHVIVYYSILFYTILYWTNNDYRRFCLGAPIQGPLHSKLIMMYLFSLISQTVYIDKGK